MCVTLAMFQILEACVKMAVVARAWAANHNLVPCVARNIAKLHTDSIWRTTVHGTLPSDYSDVRDGSVSLCRCLQVNGDELSTLVRMVGGCADRILLWRMANRGSNSIISISF